MKKRYYISGLVLIGLALVISGLAWAEDVTLTTYYPAPYGAYQELLAERYGRPAHHNGALVGSYNNVGANSYKSSPIYVIGSSYQPIDAALSNMYGIGYTHTNASFITDSGPNSWGMYVAADGDARIFLAASASGSSYFNTGNVGIGTTSPGAKLDVQGQIIGGFGARTTGGTRNWNDTSNIRSGSGYTLLLGSHANGPGPGTYFHPFNFEYSSKNGTGNMTQLAIPYGATSHMNSGMYMRGKYSGSWSNWMRIITANNTGNVGIRTTRPTASLHVVGTYYDGTPNVAGTQIAEGLIELTRPGSFPYIDFKNDTGSGDYDARIIYRGANDMLGFDGTNVGIGYTSGTAKLSVNGNVGIGTSAPQALLHVAGTILQNNGGQIRAKNSAGTAETWMWPRWSDNIMYTNFGSGGWNIRNNSSANVMFMKSNGNVGIGTSNPLSKLSIGANGLSTYAVYVTGGSTGGLYARGQYGVYGSGTTYGVYGAGGTGGGVGGSGDGYGVRGLDTNNNTYGYLGCGVWGLYTPNHATYSKLGYFPFTGSHHTIVKSFHQKFEKGMVVSVTGEVRKSIKGDNSVDISNTMPTVELSSENNDKKVLGVFNEYQEPEKEYWYYNDMKETEKIAGINALGEGRVLVTDFNSEIETGDYITTSKIPGYGMKQTDDLLHNYTLGKAIEDVDWESVEQTIEWSGKEYKVYLIAVIYTSG